MAVERATRWAWVLLVTMVLAATTLCNPAPGAAGRLGCAYLVGCNTEFFPLCQ